MVNALLARVGTTLGSRLLVDQRGATAVEHGVIVGLVTIVILGAVGTLGGTLFGWFSDVDPGLGTP